MAWGVSDEATEKEKIKAKMQDYLNGLNSVGAISYNDYSEAFDFSMKLLDQMYELGLKESFNKKSK